MITQQDFKISHFIKYFFIPNLWYLVYVGAVYYAYEYMDYKHIDIKMSMATILGFAVSLVLGFRTSASYDRWWEARKIWGGIVNDSRSLIRQSIAFLPGEEINADQRKMMNYQLAWCYSLNKSLRNLPPLEHTGSFLTTEEMEYLKTQKNVPSALLKFMAKEIKDWKKDGKIDTYQMVALDETLSRLCDHMGKAERIKNTVFPTSYRSYVHTGIIMFLLMLPFGMLYSTGPFVILISYIVSIFFFMLERIAMALQDPFSNLATDIPMDALCNTIEINLKQLCEEESLPEKVVAENGVLM